MAALRHFPQHMQNSSLHAQWKVTSHADLIGQTVGQQKPDAVHLLRQRIGILTNLGNRAGAKYAVNTERQRSPDSMTLKKNHDILHTALLLPGLNDPARAHFADAADIHHAQRLL